MLSSFPDLSPDLAQVRRLEELAFAGWPALESRDVAGWRLRFSGGYTKEQIQSMP
jgi:N-acetylglutamate synthase